MQRPPRKHRRRDRELGGDTRVSSSASLAALCVHARSWKKGARTKMERGSPLHFFSCPHAKHLFGGITAGPFPTRGDRRCGDRQSRGEEKRDLSLPSLARRMNVESERKDRPEGEKCLASPLISPFLSFPPFPCNSHGDTKSNDAEREGSMGEEERELSRKLIDTTLVFPLSHVSNNVFLVLCSQEASSASAASQRAARTPCPSSRSGSAAPGGRRGPPGATSSSRGSTAATARAAAGPRSRRSPRWTPPGTTWSSRCCSRRSRRCPRRCRSRSRRPPQWPCRPRRRRPPLPSRRRRAIPGSGRSRR